MSKLTKLWVQWPSDEPGHSISSPIYLDEVQANLLKRAMCGAEFAINLDSTDVKFGKELVNDENGNFRPLETTVTLTIKVKYDPADVKKAA